MAATDQSAYISSVGYAATAQWAAATAYTVGQRVRQLAAPAVNNERIFICSVAGTSGATEPAWSLNRYARTTDGGASWFACDGMPALNGDLVNSAVWTASTQTTGGAGFSIGSVIRNTVSTHLFILTTAGGNTGSTEPTWNTTTGATTNDGSNVWTCLGAVGSFAAWSTPCARINRLLDAGINSANYQVFYVADNHAETNAPSLNSNTWLAVLLCIDRTAALPVTSAASLRATASVSGGSFSLGNLDYVYGVQFISNGNITFGSNTYTKYDHCTFSLTSAAANNIKFWFSTNLIPVRCDYCTFNFSNAAHNLQNVTYTYLRNCVLTGVAPTTLITSTNSPMLFEACDLSNATGALFAGGSAVQAPVVFKDCKLGVTTIVMSAPTSVIVTAGQVELNRCDSLPLAVRNERWTQMGVETTVATVVRTNGAIDGSVPVAHMIAATTAAVFNNPHPGIPIVIWNAITGGSRGATFYGIVNDSRVPTNGEFWVDVEYLGSAVNPLGSTASGSKLISFAPNVPLTPDTSAWDSQAVARNNSTAYVVGDTRKVASNPGRVFFCITAGTSAASEPGGYASAVDGGSVTDGSAVFRAGCRFSQIVSLNSPYPGLPGYLYAYPKVGRASMTYYLDPMIYLN